ncbi:MAG: VCBS repeat-containing protein, partial [Candidatus Gracilibacteria bacterium]|nr:VCBS repeat-containing protein [Candidatus Gracilibacteria bacterium]
DAYIVRLNPGQNGGDSADDLVYSSYLGGSSDDNGRDLAVIDAENVLIVGDTASAANGAFLGTGAAFPGAMGGVNAFFTVYDTTTHKNFQATAANPVPYAQNVSTSTTPTITFDVAPTVNSANAEVKLFSQWHGRLLFSSTVNNNVLTLTPDQNTPFRSGDTVLVTMDENALTTADTRALIETQLYKLSFASAQAPATFPSKTDYDLTNPGQDVKLADVDADGDLDVLVMTDTNIEVHLNNGSGVFAAGNSFGPDNQAVAPGSIAIGDLNEDGIPDVFIAGADEQAYTFLGNGNATFTQNSILANDLEGASFDAGPAELTDVDHDGDLDVVMMLTNISIPGSPGGYIIFLNDGNGTLSAGNNLVAGSNGLNFTL